MHLIEPENDEVKKALILTPDEAREVIKGLEEQLAMGFPEPQIVIEWDGE